MREIADYGHLILPHAQACPEPVYVQHLRWAAQQFCERTRIWRASKEFTMLGGACEQVCTEQHAQIFEIERSWFDGRALEPRGYGEFEQSIYEDSQPRWITQKGPGSVKLMPGPQESGVLRIDMFLKPSQQAEDFPDFLSEFEQIIADGALSRILILPNQPFTDPAMGSAFGGSFQMALDQKFNMNTRGKQRAPARTKARYL